jgi:hypothetical protein
MRKSSKNVDTVVDRLTYTLRRIGVVPPNVFNNAFEPLSQRRATTESPSGLEHLAKPRTDVFVT